MRSLVVALVVAFLSLFGVHDPSAAERTGRASSPSSAQVGQNQTHDCVNQSAQVTTKATLYLAVDDPMQVEGNATCLSSLQVTFYLSEPIDQYSLVATSTVTVADGGWSLALPGDEQIQGPGNILVCLFRPADKVETQLSPENENDSFTCKEIAIQAAVNTVSLTPTRLMGDVSPNVIVPTIDIEIYAMTSTGSLKDRTPALSTSTIPVNGHWSIPIGPPLKAGGYEVYLYLPKKHDVPLQQSGLVVQ